MEITYSSQKDNMRYEAARVNKIIKRSATKSHRDLKFKLNQSVYNSIYGQGKIIALPSTGKVYTVWFHYYSQTEIE